MVEYFKTEKNEMAKSVARLKFLEANPQLFSQLGVYDYKDWLHQIQSLEPIEDPGGNIVEVIVYTPIETQIVDALLLSKMISLYFPWYLFFSSLLFQAYEVAETFFFFLLFYILLQSIRSFFLNIWT